ncbi:hypothetical protein JKP88DRAFT_243740 [Tribonema minus]|uniref:Uncharacterized protein n=1 Tax=Tribonema minus TaxID=303371 RepID=A0A836CLS7_9STRA|nr:hypothetical protein JKP88DRAFT_243740 [Tribonema minus]
MIKSCRRLAALLLLVHWCSVATFPSYEQRRAAATPGPVCLQQTAACEADPTCSACVQSGTIPPRPADVTACVDLQKWLAAVSFPQPAKCKFLFGGTKLSDLIYCRFDTYAEEAGLKCPQKILNPLSPAPTGAPTSPAAATAPTPPTRALTSADGGGGRHLYSGGASGGGVGGGRQAWLPYLKPYFHADCADRPQAECSARSHCMGDRTFCRAFRRPFRRPFRRSLLCAQLHGKPYHQPNYADRPKDEFSAQSGGMGK